MVLITVLELLKIQKLLYLKMVDLLVILVKMTASDYTHLFGYLNPYYRSAYNIPKRRK